MNSSSLSSLVNEVHVPDSMNHLPPSMLNQEKVMMFFKNDAKKKDGAKSKKLLEKRALQRKRKSRHALLYIEEEDDCEELGKEEEMQKFEEKSEEQEFKEEKKEEKSEEQEFKEEKISIDQKKPKKTKAPKKWLKIFNEEEAKWESSELLWKEDAWTFSIVSADKNTNNIFFKYTNNHSIIQSQKDAFFIIKFNLVNDKKILFISQEEAIESFLNAILNYKDFSDSIGLKEMELKFIINTIEKQLEPIDFKNDFFVIVNGTNNNTLIFEEIQLINFFNHLVKSFFFKFDYLEKPLLNEEKVCSLNEYNKKHVIISKEAMDKYNFDFNEVLMEIFCTKFQNIKL